MYQKQNQQTTSDAPVLTVTRSERIREAFDRKRKAVELRRSVARGTAVTRVKVREGFTCDVEEGPWKFTADMGEKYGGNNEGPNPGVYGRAAVASCLAIGYMMWASYRGVPITSLEVDLEADYDSAGELGVADTPAGYSRMRYRVTVESAAPEADVTAVLDEADARSSWLDIIRRPMDIRGERIIRSTGG